MATPAVRKEPKPEWLQEPAQFVERKERELLPLFLIAVAALWLGLYLFVRYACK